VLNNWRSYYIGLRHVRCRIHITRRPWSQVYIIYFKSSQYKKNQCTVVFTLLLLLCYKSWWRAPRLRQKGVLVAGRPSLPLKFGVLILWYSTRYPSLTSIILNIYRSCLWFNIDVNVIKMPLVFDITKREIARMHDRMIAGVLTCWPTTHYTLIYIYKCLLPP
jgi:hypothetical protein